MSEPSNKCIQLLEAQAQSMRRGLRAIPVTSAKEVRFCINCGEELPATAKFCDVCGTKLR